MRHLIFITMALLISDQAFSHSRLLSAPLAGQDPTTFLSPPPRDNVTTTDLTGGIYKLAMGSVPPCGNNTASSNLTAYTPGQMVKFQWEETIQHVGFFVFQISSDGGATFSTIGQYTDDLNDNNTPHYFPSAAQSTFMVQLPAALTCDHCIVRFLQHMDSTLVGTHGAALDTVDYFSCADIKIAAAGTVTKPPAPPAPGGNSSQSSTAANPNNPGAQFSSCGIIASHDHHDGGLPPAQMAILMSLLLLPMLLTMSLRPQRIRRRRF